MEAKHTPGPWSFVDHSWCDKSVYASLHQTDEKRICAFHLDEYSTSDEDEATEIANARLIAAAPELLAALRSCLSLLECVDPPSPGYEPSQSILDARAAIAKATEAGNA